MLGVFEVARLNQIKPVGRPKSTPTHEATERQLAILEFIRKGCRAGRSPTIREIAKAFQINSPNGVVCHLNALVKKGLLRRTGEHRACSYLPVDAGPSPETQRDQLADVLRRLLTTVGVPVSETDGPEQLVEAAERLIESL